MENAASKIIEKVESGTEMPSSLHSMASVMADQEEVPPEYASNMYLHKMTKLVDKKNACSFHEYDERTKSVLSEYRRRMLGAVKPLAQKVEEKKPPIERRLEESDRKLAVVLNFGNDLISNTKVADEKRELQRREFEIRQAGMLQTELKAETVESVAQFDSITARWSELEEYKEPISLFEQLEKQKQSVSNLMANKDAIIDKCQAEIDRINAKYEDEQRRQANDVRCLVERIDKQTELIKQTYNSHLEMLQQTIENERQNIDITAANKWKVFYDEMRDNDEIRFDLVKEKQQFYAKEIQRITEQQEEITRATRLRLEKESEQLEWELRKVKNTVLMNSEKLDYNYQVMQKRNEENIVINNQQKRRVARLTEGISALKLKLNTTTANHASQLRKYSDDIHKLHASISEMEIKLQQFRQLNLKKFNLVWGINFKENKTLLLKAFEIDRILHEQQLAIPYQMPHIDLTDINADADVEAIGRRAPKKRQKHTPKTDDDFDVGLLRNIIRKLSDRGRFLVEEKLLKILDRYTEEEQCIVRIDNIFTALRIENMQMVKALTKCFQPYAYCPNCSTGISAEAIRKFYKLPADSPERGPVKEATPPDSSSTSFSTTSDSTDSASNTEVKGCKNHYLVIEPAFVLSALGEFTKQQTAKRNLVLHQVFEVRNRNLIPFNNEEIKRFWKRFSSMFPQEKHKLWNTLEHGLNHYLDVLKQRAKLDEECSFLRRQNLELKHLLQKFKV